MYLKFGLYKIYRSRLAGALLVAVGSSLIATLSALEVVKTVEESITVVKNPNNGADPFWCFGSHILARTGDEVYVSVLNPDDGYKPYCNSHWEIWKRKDGEWKTKFQGPPGMEREPCPIGLLGENELVISIHPKSVKMPEDGGDSSDVPQICAPNLVGFDLLASDPDETFKSYYPRFPKDPQFRQHSYRGMGIDREAGEVLLLVINRHTYQPSHMDKARNWEILPALNFPIRACYPQVALKNGAAHVMAVGDIDEPVAEWSEYKYGVLQSKWDYVFRRLFYTWSPNARKSGFREPIEIDSAEETAGYIRNLDMWLDPKGRAHLLYLKRNHQYDFMRDKFFPGSPMTASLHHVIVDQGRIVQREKVLETSGEPGGNRNLDSIRLDYARFHLLETGRLAFVYSGIWRGEDGFGRSAFFLSTLEGGKETVRLPVGSDLRGAFFTNTPRGGSRVGPYLDILSSTQRDDLIDIRYVGFEIREN